MKSCKACAGHTKGLNMICNDIQWWLDENKVALHTKVLQCEQTAVLGWLLCSHGDMDQTRITHWHSSGHTMQDCLSCPRDDHDRWPNQVQKSDSS